MTFVRCWQCLWRWHLVPKITFSAKLCVNTWDCFTNSNDLKEYYMHNFCHIFKTKFSFVLFNLVLSVASCCLSLVHWSNNFSIPLCMLFLSPVSTCCSSLLFSHPYIRVTMPVFLYWHLCLNYLYSNMNRDGNINRFLLEKWRVIKPWSLFFRSQNITKLTKTMKILISSCRLVGMFIFSSFFSRITFFMTHEISINNKLAHLYILIYKRKSTRTASKLTHIIWNS